MGLTNSASGYSVGVLPVDGNKGDVVVSGSGSVWTLSSGAAALVGKSNVGHTHITSDVTDFQGQLAARYLSMN